MNINVTLVKVVGEEDNNDLRTEYFRVYKVETILMQPELNTKLILESSAPFFIHKLEQNLQKSVVYLYEFNWIFYRTFWSDKKEFDKIKRNLVEKEGWSPTDKHKILRGGV